MTEPAGPRTSKSRALNPKTYTLSSFRAGTHLVTCQNQPALGCVYKLVEFGGKPRIKLSQEIKKVSIPGKKVLYRLYGRAGYPLVDLMNLEEEEPPKSGDRVMCRLRAYQTLLAPLLSSLDMQETGLCAG